MITKIRYFIASKLYSIAPSLATKIAPASNVVGPWPPR